jgi:hypothetical protein
MSILGTTNTEWVTPSSIGMFEEVSRPTYNVAPITLDLTGTVESVGVRIDAANDVAFKFRVFRGSDLAVMGTASFSSSETGDVVKPFDTPFAGEAGEDYFGVVMTDTYRIILQGSGTSYETQYVATGSYAAPPTAIRPAVIFDTDSPDPSSANDSFFWRLEGTIGAVSNIGVNITGIYAPNSDELVANATDVPFVVYNEFAGTKLYEGTVDITDGDAMLSGDELGSVDDSVFVVLRWMVGEDEIVYAGTETVIDTTE